MNKRQLKKIIMNAVWTNHGTVKTTTIKVRGMKFYIYLDSESHLSVFAEDWDNMSANVYENIIYNLIWQDKSIYIKKAYATKKETINAGTLTYLMINNTIIVCLDKESKKLTFKPYKPTQEINQHIKDFLCENNVPLKFFTIALSLHIKHIFDFSLSLY